MTHEEAAEEVLRGAFTICRRCNGSGEGKDSTFTKTNCDSCGGSGKWRRGDYATACIVLGMELPPKPQSIVANWSIQKFKDLLAAKYRPQDPFRKEYMGVFMSSDGTDASND